MRKTILILVIALVLSACTQAAEEPQEIIIPEPEPIEQPVAEEPPRAILPFSQDTVTLTDNPMLADFEDSSYDMTLALTVPALHEVFNDYFQVGIAINGNARSNAAISSPELAAIIKYHANSTVYTNLMKPSYLLDHEVSTALAEEGDQAAVGVNFASCIPGLDFAKENNLGMRGHTLVWHTQTPDWFFHVDYNTELDLVDKETMLARMENYIRQVLEFTQENYPGVIHSWDVVNEAVSRSAGHFDNSTGWFTRTHVGSGDDARETLWYKVVGVDYVEKAFEFARRYAAPDVRLFYNDYNTFDTPKTDAIVALLEMLLEKDLIDGMGMQSAFGLNWPSDVRTSFTQALGKFGELGLEIHMTEVTMRVDNENQFFTQANKYKEFFDTLLEMHVTNGGPANITNVTFFGIMDRYLFYPDDTQLHWLFDADLQPKPSYYAVAGAVEQ
jgi:endo-1,4-beta-xylanase